MTTLRLCSIPDCNKPAKSAGLCSMHCERKRKYGSPYGGKYHHGARREFLFDVVLRSDTDACLFFPKSMAAKQFHPCVRIDGRTVPAARVACEMVYGPPPHKHEAAHSCGNGHLGCINPRHLRWATHKENMADREKHGTTARGEKVGISKLTESDVREIRALRGKVGIVKLGDRFGVSDTCISAIHVRKSWAWLD